jgi:hypothetical protein
VWNDLKVMKSAWDVVKGTATQLGRGIWHNTIGKQRLVKNKTISCLFPTELSLLNKLDTCRCKNQLTRSGRKGRFSSERRILFMLLHRNDLLQWKQPIGTEKNICSSDFQQYLKLPDFFFFHFRCGQCTLKNLERVYSWHYKEHLFQACCYFN